MCGRRLILPGEELLGEHVEGSWIAFEKIDFEHRSRLWEVILCEIVVEPGAGRAKVGNACRDGDACTAHDDNVFTVCFDVFSQALEVKAFEHTRMRRRHHLFPLAVPRT